MIATRVAKSGKELAEYGVSINDANGNLRSTYDILMDLAPKWNEMSKAEQVALGNTLAGTQQYKILAAILSQASVAQESYQQALNSSGETMKQNEVYMSGLEAKTNLLKAEFEKLVIGKGGLQDFAKILVDMGTAILKFANSDIGKAIISITALGVGFKVLTTSILDTGRGLVTYALMAGGMTAENAMLIASNMGLAESFTLVATTWLATPMGMATVAIAGIVALVATAEKFNNTLENQTEKLEKNANAYKQAQGEVENLKNKLENVRSQIEKINNQDNISVTDQEQLRTLEKEEAVLIRQLAIRNKLAEKAKEEAEESAKRALQSQVLVDKSTGLFDVDILADPTVVIEKSTKAYHENQLQIDSLTESLKNYVDENGNVIEGYENVVDKVNERIDSLQEEQDAISEVSDSIIDNFQKIVESLPDGEMKDRINGFIDAWLNVTGATEKAKNEIQGIDDTLEEESEVVDEATKKLEELAEAHNVDLEELKEWAKELGMSEEALLNYADSIGVSVQQAYEYQRAIKAWDDAIDNLQSAYSTLTSAVDEYNESNGFSLDTLQSLLNLSPEYLGMLTEENGKLVLNEQAIINKANALIEERKQTALQIAMERLSALETGNNTKAINEQKGKIDSNIDSINAETQALSLNTVEQAKNAYIRSGVSGDKARQANQIVKDLKQELAMIEKIGDGYGKVTTNAIKAGNASKSASKGATKALKDQNDAIKEQNKELENLKSNYEKVISYINSALDDKIESIQKEKDSALEAVEEEIKGIEKEKDSALKAIDETIKAREKEKKKALENIEAEIQAIEKEKNARLGELKARKKELQNAQDEELKFIQEKIDLLKKESETVTNTYQIEINSLKELKEEREKYWDSQINALKEANNQRKDSLELQQKLDAIEKAKATKVKVYKKGEGFVYDVDQTKVSEAQKALDEYLSEKAYEDELQRLENLKKSELENYTDRINELTKFKNEQSENYKEQIEELTNYKNDRKQAYQEEIEALDALIDSEQEKYNSQLDILKEQKDKLSDYYTEMIDGLKEYKESVQNSYEEQIKALEEHKDALGRTYDEEIKYYQDYKTQFKKMVDSYEDNQKKLLFSQLTGLNAENDNWMTRLDNLTNFVNEYNRILAQLDSIDSKTTPTTTTSGGGSTGGSSGGSGNGGGSNNSNDEWSDYDTRGFRLATGYRRNTRTNEIVKKYASGVSSVKEDEIAVVGEDPNKELVIGSKVNNGQLMSLGKGTGVVNAKATKSMAGLLNQVGAFGGSSFGAGGGVLNNNTTNNDAFTVNGVTINGAGITDPQSFATALMNLKSEAIQRAYKKLKS